ncbi:copper resistance CopC/CopD family protein [Gemmatimonas sp.]
MHKTHAILTFTTPSMKASRLILAVLLMLAPGTIHAHGGLKRSQPVANERLSAPPRFIRLEFSDAPALALVKVELRGPRGVRVQLESARLEPEAPRVVLIPVVGNMTAGEFTVTWQLAGADGHPVHGRYRFMVEEYAARGEGAASTGEDSDANTRDSGQSTPFEVHHAGGDSAAEGEFDAESPAYVALRFLLFVSLIASFGTLTYRFAVLRLLRHHARTYALLRRQTMQRAATWGVIATAGVGVAAAGRLVAQSYAMNTPGGALDWGFIGVMVTQTVWGWGWLLQVAASVIAAAGFTVARRAQAHNSRGAEAGWLIAASGTLMLAVTPALSGHASAVTGKSGVAILADAMHVIGAGGWLGTLLVVLLVAIPATARAEPERTEFDFRNSYSRQGALASLMHAFSPVALACGALVGLMGVVAAWFHVDPLSALWTTRYGRLLLLKLALLVGVGALGAYNWLRIIPALEEERDPIRLRRAATAELIIGAAVVLVTAVLVATPSPRDLTNG